ncbi:MAG: hypothetical protein AAGH89_13320, partial [Verrucomicrobiota bacterium]
MLVITVPAQALVTNLDSRLATSEKALQHNLKRVIPNSKPFPYWHNVGRVHASSAIYLGNNCVLTAAHVGPGTFELSDGSQYEKIPGSAAVYKNPDQTFTELCIFQVKSRRRDSLRKLPSIRVRIAPPTTGDLILMIGRGASEKPGVNEWIRDGKKRWGFNIVSHTARTPFANFFGETH